MKIPIHNKSQKQVGFYNNENQTYYRVINKKQQFQHPAHEGKLAISRDIIRRLVKLGCKKFNFRLLEWEEKPFDVIIDIKHFMENMESVYYGGKENADHQWACRLQHWTRKYLGQEVLK